MKQYIFILLAIVTLTACKKDKEEQPEQIQYPEPNVLSLNVKSYDAKSGLPCKADTCTYVSLNILEATGGNETVADSINKKIFTTIRNIVYFGEKPTSAKTYDEITSSFIKSYDELAGKYPDEAIPWAANIKINEEYRSDKLINIKLNNYMYTGGAHGYEGNLSLLFDAKTGKIIKNHDLFTDMAGFTKYAEKKFREKYKIAAGKPINSTGFTFEDEKFILPQNMFFGKDGLLLVYNPYEITSFADGAKEVLLPYRELYDEIISSYIKSYDELAGKYPKAAIPWAANIQITEEYRSDKLINIKVNDHMHSGSAYGYVDNLSLLFDAKTGKIIKNQDLFTNMAGFIKYAEKKFREKYKIAAGKPISSRGFKFKNEKFILPQNIFYNKDGLLLLYNPYEITSFADETKEVLLPYGDLKPYLKIK